MKIIPYLSDILPSELWNPFADIEYFFFLVQYIVGAFCIYRTVGLFLEIKKNLLARFFLILGSSLVGAMIIYLADLDNLPPTMALFMAAVYLGGKGSPLKRITIGLIISCTVFTYNALIDNFLTSEHSYGGMWRLAFSIGLYLLARQFSPRKKEFELSRSLWGILLLLTAAPIGIVLCMVLLSQYGETRNDVKDMALLGLALFSFAGLLGTVAVLARQKELEEEQTLIRMNENYYKALQEQNFEVRRLKHDLSNHLQTVLSLPEKEKDVYIKKLLENPAAYRTVRYCADETVNIVFSAKEGIMRQKNIPFHVEADIPCALSMEKTDICAILGNALDNAIESAVLFPEKERYVRVEARLAKGIFVLKVENPGKEPSMDKEGRIKTSKTDEKFHGYGLLSIEKSVKKYGGELEIKMEEGKFTLFLYMNQ